MLKKFIDYLLEQVGCIYVWGAQGQRATEDLIDRRETSANNKKRAKRLLQKRLDAGYAPENIRAYDCSGLGMYWLQNLTKIYGYDMSSNSMMGKCASIGKSALRKGDWVFRIYKSGSNKGKAYHIGYIVDEALNVIEAKGRDDGVVKRGLNASGKSYWNAFGRPEVFKSEIEIDGVRVIGRHVNVRNADSTAGDVLGIVQNGAVLPYLGVAPSGWYNVEYNGQNAYISNRADLTISPESDRWVVSRLLKKQTTLMRGEDVKAVQRALGAAGHNVGKHGADGVYGNDTKSAVIAYQRAHKLKVDGIVGRQTVAALGGKWAV